jgi:hypothetical protein
MRDLGRLCHVGKGAVPEENRETDVRPHLRKSGLAFRGRCNGPPQGLVCPPAWVGKPGSISAERYRRPAEEAVSEGKGLKISPRAGRLKAALKLQSDAAFGRSALPSSLAGPPGEKL